MGKRAIIRVLVLLLIVLLSLNILLFFLKRANEGFQSNTMNKTIWLLWLQGWDTAPWLIQNVRESWEIQNPGWKIQLITKDNLKNFVTDIDYVYKDSVSSQAKSDIIRLSLLNKHGGVWADATLLCMKPLDSWIDDAIKNSNFWMYHGTGGNMDVKIGPSSWFIVSKRGSTIIQKWKAACDVYWGQRESTNNYFWMDALFKNLYETDSDFKNDWDKVPYINSADPGQAHMFASGSWKENDPETKNILDSNPPRVLKLWNQRWEEAFPDIKSQDCISSNGYYAIQKAKIVNETI
jgi:hypothetical protein